MDHRGNGMPQDVRLTSLARRAQMLSASIALSLVIVSAASAATDIQGTADDLRLTVDNATLSDVLTALSSRFKIRYRLRSSNPRVISGHYSGTLRETVTRLLDGNDYFLEVSENGLEVIVLGASRPQNMPQGQVASTPAPTPPTSPTASPPAPAAAPQPPVAVSSRSVSPSIPALPVSAVPPLSSFAVLPPP